MSKQPEGDASAGTPVVTGAVIGGARVAAAHDGVAELRVELCFPGGGRSEIVLDTVAAEALFRICDVDSLGALGGHGWESVRDALTHAWNRPTSSPPGALRMPTRHGPENHTT